MFTESVASPLLAKTHIEPTNLKLSDQPVPVEQFISALKEAGYDVPLDAIKPLGTGASSGWDAIVGKTRFLFQGKGKFADIHRHNLDETSKFHGEAHLWTHEFNDWTYTHCKDGNTITIPAGVPHTLVVTSKNGVLMVRSSESNPQLPTETPLPRPSVVQKAFELLVKGKV